MRISAAKTKITTFIIVSLLLLQSIAFEINDFFPDERDGLVQLRDVVNSTADLHGNWTGPPCSTKNESRWVGIACSDWHITHLVLEGIQLTGSLPPMFLMNLTFLNKLSFSNNSLRGPLPDLTNLVHLEFVSLSKNQFSGTIPSAYINLPHLTNLELQENDISGGIPPFNQQSLIAFNVSSNELEGPIPETPVLRRFPESSYSNNTNLCGDIPGLNEPCPVPPLPSRMPKDGGGLKWWGVSLIATAASLVPVLLILIFLGRVFRKTREDQASTGEATDIERRETRSHWSGSSNDPLELEFVDKAMGMGTFELDDLLRAAAEEIGRGESGTTYKAVLECGSVVAVKRLVKDAKALSKKEFVQQMHLLANLKHENLVQIISFYHSKEEKLIVYAHASDDTLFSLLHENRGRLGWNARVGIIKEVAKGVEFLHAHGSLKVPHGNLQSSNVVVVAIQHDGSIQVKLTDYGLLGVVMGDKLSVGTTPEFGDGKKVTRKADVYCFGILVLEIVTGKAPALSPSQRDLSGWVRAAVTNDWSTDVLDVEILGEKDGHDDMLKLIEIALECTDELPERRPTMTQVLTTLQDITHH